MIRPERLSSSLRALHRILIRARALAHEGAPTLQIADLLDIAETLPRLIASERDETAEFRAYVEHASTRHKCMFALQWFDEPAPQSW